MSMIKVGLIGAGKMGISHLAILGMHPDVELVGVADQSTMVLDVIRKLTHFKPYSDYRNMMEQERPDAVVVAAPTRLHEPLVQELVDSNIHVFVEKPFCMHTSKGRQLVNAVKEKRLVNQVGYHNKFMGTFNEAKRILDGGYIGSIQHFSGDMNGPVVVKKKDGTWRSKPEEGGGCLMDYAAHLIDLLGYLIAPLDTVLGADLLSYYSGHVEDAVYCMLVSRNGIHGNINVNWSDDAYRKMSTAVTIDGTLGKIIVDTTEIKVHFRTDNCPSPYVKGWNVRHINELAPPVSFYLRGEEYSAQMDKFINAVSGKSPNDINTFETALHTDLLIEKIKNYN
jgi:predicted dehydrogenase